MQSGKDPDYATGKTKRNATGRPGMQLKAPERNRQTRYATGRPGTEPADPERNRPTRNGTGAKHD